MLKNLGLGITCGIAFLGSAQNDIIQKYSETILAKDLKQHLTVLASDEYEGRETGKKGQKMTAAYLVEQFKNMGCSMAPGMTSYEQFFDVIETKPGGTISVSGQPLAFKKDFIYFGAKSKVELNNLPLVTMESLKLQDVGACIIVHALKSMDVRSELAQLRKEAPKTVKGFVFISDQYDTLYTYLEHYATGSSMRLADEPLKEDVPFIVVRNTALAPALKKPFLYLVGKGKQKPLKKAEAAGEISVSINADETKLTSSNVLAFIPGTDPKLAKEIVVVTAHYDHIGIDNGIVYNGADDDGTGTVGLIELAQAFMEAKKAGKGPKRSVLIMPVSGEEKGLLGSAYYASHPIFPLTETIADLNIDMIGRNDIAHETESDYIYVIGSNMLSDDLHNTNELANNTFTNLKLDYRFNNKTDPNQFYYRSDHYNFAKNGIPSVFFFSGVHADYHQPTDDIEKINFDKVMKVSRLVFATTWMLADAVDRPHLKE